MGSIKEEIAIPPKSLKFAIGSSLTVGWFLCMISADPLCIVDRGGTFTDVWCSVPGQKDIILKLLSVDPDNYDDAPSEGIRRVLETVSGQPINRRSPIPKDLIHSIRMGTTVATNGKVMTGGMTEIGCSGTD